VLPTGELINLFNLTANFENAHQVRGVNIALIRSSDQGATWSRRATIVDKQIVPRVTDPDTDQPYRSEDGLVEVAVNRNHGELYAVWQDGRFTGRAAVAFSMSTDGGVTWSPTIKINQTPALGNLNDQAFIPSVDVADDGTVGVTYYDFRNNTAGGGTATDLWLVHCHAACTSAANWQENHVAGPFDSRKAPFSRGFFLGDYVGLDHRGNTFTPFFTQTTATDPANQYYVEVGP
jgi:hypothetical protein